MEKSGRIGAEIPRLLPWSMLLHREAIRSIDQKSRRSHDFTCCGSGEATTTSDARMRKDHCKPPLNLKGNAPCVRLEDQLQRNGNSGRELKQPIQQSDIFELGFINDY